MVKMDLLLSHLLNRKPRHHGIANPLSRLPLDLIYKILPREDLGAVYDQIQVYDREIRRIPELEHTIRNLYGQWVQLHGHDERDAFDEHPQVRYFRDELTRVTNLREPRNQLRDEFLDMYERRMIRREVLQAAKLNIE